MKIFLISGSHPRHLHIHKEIINLGYETKALVMSREEMLPVIPKDLPSIDVKNTFAYLRSSDKSIFVIVIIEGELIFTYMPFFKKCSLSKIFNCCS